MGKPMRLFVLFVAILLNACAVHRPDEQNLIIPDPPFNHSLYKSKPLQSFEVASVYRLSAPQRQEFLDKYNSSAYKDLMPNKRISRYISEELSNFAFDWKTLTANESVASKTGNCLSMAIVTKSLADLVNVEINYELVASPPVYQKEGEVVLISQHVRTILRDPRPGDVPGYKPFWRGGIRVDYFPSEGNIRLRSVEESEFHSMYFGNKAVEAIGDNQDALAFEYLQQALYLDKSQPEIINILAVIHERANDLKSAERLYLYGLKYGGDSFVLLSNYQNLLEEQGRNKEAKKIATRLRKYHDPNPYKWVDLGNKEFEESNFSSAIRYYKKARELAEYLHEPHAGIARANFSLGNIGRAKKAYRKAIQNSRGQPILDQYKKEYQRFFQEVVDG